MPSPDAPPAAGRAAQRAWALTAWANHGFTTTVLVGFFPLFLARSFVSNKLLGREYRKGFELPAV